MNWNARRRSATSARQLVHVRMYFCITSAALPLLLLMLPQTMSPTVIDRKEATLRPMHHNEEEILVRQRVDADGIEVLNALCVRPVVADQKMARTRRSAPTTMVVAPHPHAHQQFDFQATSLCLCLHSFLMGTHHIYETDPLQLVIYAQPPP